VTDRAKDVERWWRAFVREGPDGFLRHVPEDVEWVPLSAQGRVLRGHAELREFLERARAGAGRFDAGTYRFEERGACVVVSGRLRQYFEGGGFEESQPTWVYFFDASGRLRRAEGFLAADEAEGAADTWNESLRAGQPPG
jgi:hypothetical protein